MSVRPFTLAALLVGCFSLAGNSFVAAQDQPGQAAPAQLETLSQKASYVLGHDIGSNIRAKGLPLDIDVFLKALAEGLQGAENSMNPEEVEATMLEFQQLVRTQQEERFKVEAEQNLRAGEEFLKANALKEGVVVLESGLQYKVINEGAGATPTVQDRVKTHYHGTLIDGTVFDSSVERGEPAVFPVGAVIRGWVEILQKMKVGDKWEVYVPSDMAYGPEGAPRGGIGPNQVLVFQIELLEVVQQ